MDKVTALKKVAGLLKRADLFERTALKVLIPELEEYDNGEVIKEALIKTFKFYNNVYNSPYLMGISKEKVIDWLEKREKVKPIFSVGDVIRKHTPELSTDSNSGDDEDYVVEEILEEKYVLKRGDETFFEDFKNQGQYTVVDSRPKEEDTEPEAIEKNDNEWSGNDSCHYDGICEVLINKLYNLKDKTNKDCLQKDLLWLFNLRKRFLEKN